MYIVTSNFVNFLILDIKAEAIRLAEMIKGQVYTNFCNEMLCVYSYGD